VLKVSEAVAVELPERMDIASAETMHMELEQVLEQGCSFELRGAAVQKVDTAGVQLLASFFTEAEKQHLSVSWQAPSEAIVETFSFLKLTAAVGLDQLAGASE
jgi:ABC-type transporter Mla MlaB component